MVEVSEVYFISVDFRLSLPRLTETDDSEHLTIHTTETVDIWDSVNGIHRKYTGCSGCCGCCGGAGVLVCCTVKFCRH